MTCFRGNAQRSTSGVGAVPRHPKLIWRLQTRTKLEGPYEQRGSAKLTAQSAWRGLGWTGQPLRVGDRVYFGASDSYVYCLDAASGAVRWFYPTHHVLKGTVTYSDGRLYHGGRDNKLHCYDASGRMVWETRIGNDMDSNPIIVDGVGYVGGEDKSIYSFDPKTGRLRWRTPTPRGTVESSVCVAEGRLYAGSDHGGLWCLDAATGKVLWTFETQGDTDSTPVYHDGRIYVGCATGDEAEKGHLWCVDAKSGKAVWHRAFPRGFWATAAINPATGRLYIGNNNGVFYCLDMAKGATIWERKLGARIWGSAAVTDGCVVVGVRDGRLWCLDENTGVPIWVFDDGVATSYGDIDATPCVAGGMIVIGSQNGWVYGIGESPAGQPTDPHWFLTAAPFNTRPDNATRGVRTTVNPAPAPKTYTDTSARNTDHLRVPVRGPGYSAVAEKR
jgi:outer membrane protein assembly factor BamB